MIDMRHGESVQEKYHQMMKRSNLLFCAAITAAVWAGISGIGENPDLVLAAAGILVLLWILNGLTLGIKISSVERQLERSDRTFAYSEEVDSAYEAPAVWSVSSGQVIAKYRSMVNNKKQFDEALQATRYIALQQQINPHFLYNTLDAIRSDLMIAGQDELADTVESLSRYFSYSISNLDRLATLLEELANVKEYFRIQKYRFEDRINMVVRDDFEREKLDSLLVPRQTLQPIVENAINHGLENSNSPGTVTIGFSETEKNILIHVSDDGVGMENAALERLNTELQSGYLEETRTGQKKRGGIALRNVNARIRLLFGEDYGLRVFSVQGAGTEVTIRLPKNYKERYHEGGPSGDM